MENPLKDVNPKQKKVLTFVAVGAAGYVAYRWFQSSRNPAPTLVTSSTDASQSATGVIGSNVGASQNVGNSSNTDSTLVSTNDVWFSQAVERLTAGGWDAQAVQSALGDFLTRQALTTSEATIVRAAVGAMGGYPPAGPTTLNEIPGVTDSSKLPAPTGLKVVSKTDTTVNLSWNAVTGAKQYRIYRSSAAQAVAVSGGTSAQVAGLNPQQSYTFYVAAGLDGDKMGPRSSGVTTKMNGMTLKAPTGLKVTNVAKTSAWLSWSATGPGQYVIRRSGSSQTWESVNNAEGLTGLKPNTRYSYQVACVQPEGKSIGPWSGYVSFTTKR